MDSLTSPAASEDQPLTGGNSTPVVRRGDAVHRESGPWTPAVHLLLRTLRAAGIDAVPEPRGLDEAGREVVSFLPGEMLADAPRGVQWSPSVLRAAGALMRRMHDASAPLASDPSLTWRSPRHRPAEVICHNDFAPYNLVITGDTLSGVIDFDYASPGPRIWDLAYLAYRLVPLAEDARAADAIDRPRRLADLIRAYGGGFEPAAVVAAAAERLDDLRDFTLERHASTGRSDFRAHAAMYARDAERLRRLRP